MLVSLLVGDFISVDVAIVSLDKVSFNVTISFSGGALIFSLDDPPEHD
jgi:hypothetical protein